jgi:hypothetical protein
MNYLHPQCYVELVEVPSVAYCLVSQQCSTHDPLFRFNNNTNNLAFLLKLKTPLNKNAF